MKRIISHFVLAALIATTVIIATLTSTQIKCQELWIERNVKHGLAMASIAAAAIAFCANTDSNLIDTALGYKHLGYSDPVKQIFLQELSSMGILYPVAIKVGNSPDTELCISHARINEVILAQGFYDAYRKSELDKDELRATIRHELSHIKNRDNIKSILYRLGIFNVLLYGTDALVRLADKNRHIPDYMPLKRVIKVILPLAAAYKLSSLIANFWQSVCEMRADKDSATDLQLAQANVRLFEKIYEQRRAEIEKWPKNPWLFRFLIGGEVPKNRLQTLRGYVKQFEQQTEMSSLLQS